MSKEIDQLSKPLRRDIERVINILEYRFDFILNRFEENVEDGRVELFVMKRDLEDVPNESIQPEKFDFALEKLAQIQDKIKIEKIYDYTNEPHPAIHIPYDGVEPAFAIVTVPKDFKDTKPNLGYRDSIDLNTANIEISKDGVTINGNTVDFNSSTNSAYFLDCIADCDPDDSKQIAKIHEHITGNEYFNDNQSSNKLAVNAMYQAKGKIESELNIKEGQNLFEKDGKTIKRNF